MLLKNAISSIYDLSLFVNRHLNVCGKCLAFVESSAEEELFESDSLTPTLFPVCRVKNIECQSLVFDSIYIFCGAFYQLDTHHSLMPTS